MDLAEKIDSLDDSQAIEVLQRFSGAIRAQSCPPTLDSAMTRQLEQQAKLSVELPLTVTGGDLARASLRLVADHPVHQAGLDALINHARSKSFALVETATVVSAALIALQTHATFVRDKNGRWSVTLEKKPTQVALLKDLLAKLTFFR